MISNAYVGIICLLAVWSKSKYNTVSCEYVVEFWRGVKKGIFISNLSMGKYEFVILGGIFQGIGGRHPRGPRLGQMARVLYPYILVYPLIVPVNRPFYYHFELQKATLNCAVSWRARLPT